MKKSKSLLTISLIIFLFSHTIYAQSKVGTTVAQFLKIDPSSRISAMGNAGASLSEEPSAIFYNPASIGRINGTQFQFTNNQWIADIDYNYAVLVTNFERIGAFALTLTSLNSGEIAVRTVESPLGTGEKYNVTNLAIGIGYGLMLTDRVSVGLQISYLNETIWHSSMSNYSLNFGVQYELEKRGLKLGASVSNFGPKSSFDGRDLFIDYDFDPEKYGDNNKLPAELRTDEFSLPTTFRVGVSYPFFINESNSITIAVDAVHPNDNDESINAGAEIFLVDAFFLRGGYRNLFLEDNEGGLILGAGFIIEFLDGFNFKFDYAYADYNRLKEAHRITLGVSLN